MRVEQISKNVVNLYMIRGDSEGITVSCTDQDGNVIPLVDGDTIYLTVKLNTGTDVKLMHKIGTNFVDNKAVIEILPSDTRELAYKSYKYDIQLVDHNGRVTTVIAPSLFTVEPEITFE